MITETGGQPNDVPGKPVEIDLNTYLPCLFWKKFRSVVDMDRLRSRFPSNQNTETNANSAFVKPPSAWDHVLRDVKQAHFVRQETKKFQVAYLSFVARKCKLKFTRRELKKEEVTCFHRVLASHLSQRVLARFQDAKPKQPDSNPILPLANQIQEQPIQRIPSATKQVNNGVFIDQDEGGVYKNDNNLFEDLLNQPQPPKKEQVVVTNTIDTYIIKSIQINGPPPQGVKVKRRDLLKKIRDCMRRRQKYKERQNPTAPKIGSAELMISELMRMEPEEEPKQQIPLARGLSVSSTAEIQKKRRKKDDGLSICWPVDEYEDQPRAKKFIQNQNARYDNLNEVLSLFVVKDSKNEEYKKAFQKTIDQDKDFPRRLQNVQNVKIDKLQEDASKDERDSNNVENLLKHYANISHYLFPEEVDLESNNNRLRLFIKQLFTAGAINSSNKMIKYEQGLVNIMNEEFFRSNGALRYVFDLHEIFFLIEYYLAELGSNWGLVAQCIKLNPICRAMLLSRQQIENLHAYYNMKRGKNITCNDRLLLPYKNEWEEPMADEPAEERTTEIDLENYEDWVLSQVEKNKEKDLHLKPTTMSRQFQKFSKYCSQIDIERNDRTIIDLLLKDHGRQLARSLDEWEFKQKGHVTNEKKAEKVEFAYQTKANLPKGCKPAVMKKRKFVSDKTSPLVQTLAKIRNKQQTQQPVGAGYNYPVKKADTPGINAGGSTVVSTSGQLKIEPINSSNNLNKSTIKSEPPKTEKVRDEKKDDPNKTPKKPVAEPKPPADDKKSATKDRKKKDDKK